MNVFGTTDVMNLIELPMDPSWRERLKDEFEKPYMKSLKQFLQQEIASKAVVYPPMKQVFNALSLTPFDQVKVVIVGQDPYHGPGQAEGLSFSVPRGIKPPPSLQNIFKEIHSEFKFPKPSHGSLVSWAKQGVLLLNTTLTVRENQPKSHFGQGWEPFTDKIIQLLADKTDPIVFLLWGKSAIDKFQHIQNKPSPHLILTAPHPSPFSAHTGFFGCAHFSKTNEFLKMHHKKEIDWSLPE